MSKTLKELVEIAAEAYPDQYLQKQLQTSRLDINAIDALSPEEVLAAYITKEFRDLYDPNSEDEQNAQRIAASLERSAHTLERVSEKLREFAAGPKQEPRETLLGSLLERLRPSRS